MIIIWINNKENLDNDIILFFQKIFVIKMHNIKKIDIIYALKKIFVQNILSYMGNIEISLLLFNILPLIIIIYQV